MGVISTTKTAKTLPKIPQKGIYAGRVRTFRFTTSLIICIFHVIIHNTETNRRMYEQLVHN